MSVCRYLCLPHIGLLHRRTGIPAFIVATGDDEPSINRLFTDRQLADLPQAHQSAISHLVHFFRVGGSECLVFVLGFHEQSGCLMPKSKQILKMHHAFFDLVNILHSHQHRHQSEHILASVRRLLGDDRMYIVEDSILNDRKKSDSHVIPITSHILASDEAIPSAPVFCALVQKCDRDLSAIHSPSHFSLPAEYKPLKRYTGGNGFGYDNGQTVFIGNYTCCFGQPFPLVRASHFLNEAIRDICSAYVFEIMNEDLCISVELTIKDFLKAHYKLLRDSSSWKIDVNLSSEFNTIHVYVAMKLAGQAVSLSINFDIERDCNDG